LKQTLVSFRGSALTGFYFGLASLILDLAKPSDQVSAGVEQKGFHRKPTAILNADVACYSRLMLDDEAATVKTFEPGEDE
jgi:hypothetical protein